VAADLSAALSCRAESRWTAVVADPLVDIVCVATPNGFLSEITLAALRAGKHVLLEKPMGRNLAEAEQIAAAARESGKKVKVGFNHRYHGAIAEAHRQFCAGEIGELINMRARYGHGGRPGYENEWRGDPTLSGGGELTDQGVHVADLISWFGGPPEQVFGYTQTAVWPLQPLEDNAFALLRLTGGRVATMHTSWTQWKNLFSFEIFGTSGSLGVEGLGGSYGLERLVVAKRNPAGGPPAMEELSFAAPDPSWAAEWDEFMRAIAFDEPYSGNPDDGVAVMRIVDALYRSAASNRAVDITPASSSPT